MRADLLAVAAVCALVAAASLVGWGYLHSGEDIILPFPPLLASWDPHVGAGSPAAVLIAILVAVHGPRTAARMSWRPLVWVAWAVSLGWTLSLALIDGWATGIAGRLTTTDEYLHDVPRVGDIAAMLRTFSDHILTDQAVFWTTHVGAHPPGAFLVFLLLDRVGLHGGGPAGLLVILIGSSAAVAVAVTARALGAEATARAALPYLVLFPGAVWVGVSADGMFAAVLAWSVALLALGATFRGRRADGAAVGGGLLLGYGMYMSYGLALGMLLPLVVIVWTRRWRAALIAVAAAVAVAGVFTAAGFWWLTGYHDLRIIYAASAARFRPYEYFVWGDLAAFACATGPAVVAGLRRMARSLIPPRAEWAMMALVMAAVVAVAAADISGLSKAEVERIWLPFGIWMALACAQLPPLHARGWLIAQATLALVINSLLLTVW
jgi:methylthioxylose transferase